VLRVSDYSQLGLGILCDYFAEPPFSPFVL